MTTFARIVGGFALDCQIAATATELAARFHPEWLAKNPFIVVPDGTLHGALDNGNGTFSNPLPPVPVVPQPVNPGNPYFGKPVLKTAAFWVLVGQVLSADRMKRLVDDSHFIWIEKVIAETTLVDPDDKDGLFLKIVTYLTTTKADDTALLMDKAERDAIMAAWK